MIDGTVAGRAPARGMAPQRRFGALYGTRSAKAQSDALTSPKRQPAGTGRRSHGGFALIPCALALRSTPAGDQS
ncbi:hypothetical protein SAMN04488026_102832 [Aliiruegeria lutimaris]|uniref:Uncharacterized protein n=1 Tax=Aliiruegeria lutimaris TaxID=571298 RepID=A0A1G8Y8F0_9RHOB|nr:hypothetical protein SAMN04488026_102832 [Aliiruegeria lutimaris]